MSTIIEAKNRWARVAIALVGAGLVYNLLEAVVALWFGALVAEPCRCAGASRR